MLTTLQRTAKAYKQQISKNQGDPETQWKALNSLGRIGNLDKSNVE